MYKFVTNNYQEEIKEYTQKEFNYRYNLLFWLSMFLALFLCSFSIMSLFLKEKTWIIILLLFSGFVFASVGLVFRNLFLNGKKSEQEIIKSIEKITTTLNEKNIVVEIKYQGKGSATSTYPYENFKRIEEHDDYFVFEAKDRTLVLLYKKNLQEGSISDFRKYLRKVVKVSVDDYTSSLKKGDNRERRRQNERKK